ncbi:MAG: biotin--[acetyl-CoA-carboxylase] ligase [Gemmatimonadota bacterium]|nr:biotin--[acetyl-CoA-carboxylase] ligase [Gemmatimonadota bacterium]
MTLPVEAAVCEDPAERWEGRTREALAVSWGVPEVHLYERVGSTNDVARSLAAAGAAAGTVVLADEQTAGRGREGRSWSSPAGLGIWLSLILRPQALPAPGLLPLRVGLAASRALDAYAAPGLVQVKWPNDLCLAGRKLGGILCEASWKGDHLAFMVVGIGINVGHAPDDFPAEIRERATSLRIAAGWSPARDEVAGALVRGVSTLAGESAALLGAAELEELGRRDPLRGRAVEVVGAERATGVVMRVTPEGELLVRSSSGVLRRYRSGTVRLLPSALAGTEPGTPSTTDPLER